MGRVFKNEGIIIKRNNFGETDKILTIFTKHYGKIKVLAKGVRKITSKRGGNLEIFNYCKFVLRKGKNFDSLSEVELLEDFDDWRKDLKKVAIAYYFCELVDKLTAEGQENYQVFELLKKFLRGLKNFPTPGFIRSFEEGLLGVLGFGIPGDLKGKQGSLKSYIEEIAQKEIKTPRLLLSRIK